MGEALELAVPPADTPFGEMAIWIAYWRSSYEASLAMTSEQIARLKANRWWPPRTAEMVGNLPPEIVRKTLRPGL
jgi:hypothetical protein